MSRVQASRSDDRALCGIRPVRGAATGFVFMRPGRIVTAGHVVAHQPAAEPVRVVFANDRAVPARVALLHPRVDLAVLELLEAGPCRSPLHPADLGSVGGPLFWAGSRIPRFERTRRQRDGYDESLIMFPALNAEPGDSGGPVLTAAGHVVAVVINGIEIGGRYFLRATAVSALLDELA